MAEAAFPGRSGRIAFSAGVYVDPVGTFPGYGQVRDYDIFTIAPGGSGVQQVTQGDFVDGFPTWSPDGRKLAFARADANSLFEYDIYVVDADGGSPVNLTQTPQYRDWEPSWSPDGSKIVFRSDRAAPEVVTRPLFDFFEGDLFIMNADGSDVRPLTSGPGFEMMPVWSPDGA
ncbi:MAG: TolB family protein, partial [Actinomycetota bacterium]